jgi:hypothetical protein
VFVGDSGEGFIGYRAGAFHWRMRTPESLFDDTTQAAPAILYSSKEGIIVEPAALHSP